MIAILKPFARTAVIALAGLLQVHPASADTATLETIKSARGATTAFILVKPTAKPTAAVMLFAGGHGGLGLKSASAMAWGSGNFLVRSRDKFAAENLVVAIIDAPDDHRGGMSAKFRMSAQHASDMAAVARHLKETTKLPVWLVGTSMGTFSAARGAIHGEAIDGLILTSSITRAKPNWDIKSSHPNGVASMDLPRIKVPTLIVAHKHDGCDITPASDAPKLVKRLTGTAKVELAVLDGGSPPQSDPCQAKSQHGFLGIEQQAVATIAKFIRSAAAR